MNSRSQPVVARFSVAVVVAVLSGVVSYYVSAIGLQGFGEPVPAAYEPNWPQWFAGLAIGVVGLALALRIVGRAVKTWWILVGVIPALFAVLTAKSIWG